LIVDVHVGGKVFHDAIVGYLKGRGKTVLLVTHAIHLLPNVDRVIVLSHGRVAHDGTYLEVAAADANWKNALEEVASEENTKKAKVQAKPAAAGPNAQQKSESHEPSTSNNASQIKEETRVTGSVGGQVYISFLKASDAWVTVPLILLATFLSQASQAGSLYSIIWWETDVFHWSTSRYMLLYSMLGVSQMVFTFIMGTILGWQAYLASKNLHNTAITKLFSGSAAFFDSTPLGRLLGVLGKDIDVMDNTLPDVLRMFIITMGTLVGSVVVISVIFNYFLLSLLLTIIYIYYAIYYQASARELKRLDSKMRSDLYSRFSESLAGSTTINAYGEANRFINKIQYLIDLGNRAYILTIANQRWLAVRLDFLGTILVLAVALYSALGAKGLNPSKAGLILTYTIQLTQIFGAVTRQAAEVENNMNSVERVSQYTRDDVVEREGQHESTGYPLPNQWPKEGVLTFDNVCMSYRDDLPLVLRNTTFSVQNGEKVGIVGRTGAGKSSIISALFRLREVVSGTVTFDGVDISKIGLQDLRSNLGIIPQEHVLFEGSVRSNLDPFGRYDDQQLNRALQKSHLVDKDGISGLNLDTYLTAEGANLSSGERALMSLARSLVSR
jgi:ABC-type multidrug transport system fused ATPase/permease subunit